MKMDLPLLQVQEFYRKLIKSKKLRKFRKFFDIILLERRCLIKIYPKFDYVPSRRFSFTHYTVSNIKIDGTDKQRITGIVLKRVMKEKSKVKQVTKVKTFKGLKKYLRKVTEDFPLPPQETFKMKVINFFSKKKEVRKKGVGIKVGEMENDCRRN
jgi:hypothetical protein